MMLGRNSGKIAFSIVGERFQQRPFNNCRT